MMKKICQQSLFLAGSFALATVVVKLILVPVLEHYVRLRQMMFRFTYTNKVLGLFVGLVIWLFIVQWQSKKLSVVYLYLVYSVYLFFLFVVLFTKSPTYHTLSLNLFDFIQLNQKILTDTVMNVLYFIPLGLLYHFKTKPRQFCVIALTTILGIETIQYVFYIGTFALSGIILNFSGCVLGYSLYPRFKVHFTRLEETKIDGLALK